MFDAPTFSITAMALSLESTGNPGMSTELMASTSTDAPALPAAPAANARFSTATASCSATSTPGTRSPYGAFSRLHRVRPAISTAAATFSLNSAVRAGCDTIPRSPAAMSPAWKFSETSSTPASAIDRVNASAAESDGAIASHGHQNSTPPNPAARAAAARWVSGSSVNRIEQFTSNRSP